jgi:uncharacterized membrane protein YgcG
MAGSRTLKLSILADVDDLKKKLDTGSKEVEGFGGKMEKFGKVAAAAFAAAAAAAAAYAVKLAVDGVKAAIEDEAAQARLANALKNVTAATDAQIAAVEQQILKTSLATGVADDSLRPALQRLATATGDVTEAQKLLDLALDISAATGKSVETVSNALGKAYEGNTGALGRLGIGLSAAEIKTLGLEGTMKELANTFGGAATVQANTLEGQISRLKVLFDETKESVGAGLLPAVKGFLDYVTNRFIPMIIEAKDKALAPIKKAFEDNEEALRALWQFGVKYLVPFFEFALKNAIEGVGKSVGLILTIIGKVVNGIEGLINKGIDGINALIKAWNAIPDWAKPGGDIAYIPKVNFTKNTDTSGQISTSTGSIFIPSAYKASDTGSTAISGGSSSGSSGGSSGGSKVVIPTPTLIEQVSEANWLKKTIESGQFDVAAARRGEESDRVVININGAIDPTSTARQIADLLNNEASVSGTFSGLGVSRFATRVE